MSANARTIADAAPAAPKGFVSLKVHAVKHWTDRTFSFTCDRPQSFRFRSGEFAMIGLMVDGKPLVRAYSIASPSWDEELEFYSIKVQEGPLTSRLQHLRPGDEIVMRPKPVGTLVHDALTPGKRLIMFSTGTGIAPFASVIRDPETYEKFDEIILTQTCRDVGELDFGKALVEAIRNDELLSELVGDKLRLFTTTTREPSPEMGRMTDWIRDGRFETATGAPLSPATDRVMICGSMGMLQEHKELCEAAGMKEGSNSEPGDFVIEKAFVD
ncbi:ferredoxin--NADP reductase [Paroceanicella profunda]|uniref:ferredoxin--NADP(+) reductase n=1 Tax=Paroceanicella profunda TaxID=2579971 RepID=A0A5B8G2L5_9RHOB|nr:ferredoxin--NADP reductase [Paroceanicella profunda]QDL92863.1 ferredoxin--NADP reductase [Paroceanicella profunda]